MAVQPEEAMLGIAAPSFTLPATSGQTYSLADVSGPKGTVVVFICNHCPYVKASVDRMVAAAKALAGDGIGFAAISSNDADAYPEDSFENMKGFARDNGFPFPYLHDATQEVAKAWEAVCTPDFFGLDADGIIRYRGRLDEGRTAPLRPGAKTELLDAMRQIAATGKGPDVQIPSIGCSIKWRD
ncbi:thioredoxin family protein [Pelagibacterium limicola]|uniref:thioredoxin family protein n=1 Tax=Pelagibacterium limicola TaxID=2791022 RepID=UPI0018AFF059|nr:thioredoxin family protein [Pelagibacterium limicola]